MLDKLADNKIVLIKRKTRLEELISRYNTIDQAKFYIEHLGSDFSDYIAEDKKYKKSIAESYNVLEGFGRIQIVDREYISNYIFGDHDLIVVVGQDGLVANTLKYLSNQILIGVNPDPARWDGILLPFRVEDLQAVVQDIFKAKRQIKEVTMAKAVLNDGQTIYAVNDLFVGQRTHVSSRYNIQLGNKKEDQSSSGIIISTGLGSSGWMKSVLAGAANVVNSVYNGNVTVKQKQMLEWDADCLLFSVREPFPSKNSKTTLIFGKVERGSQLKIQSQMPENGVIFSDGIESDYLQFNSGLLATITIAEKKGHLVL